MKPSLADWESDKNKQLKTEKRNSPDVGFFFFFPACSSLFLPFHRCSSDILLIIIDFRVDHETFIKSFLGAEVL